MGAPSLANIHAASGRSQPIVDYWRALPPRVRAGLLHLTLSLGITATLLCVVFFVWYPAPLGYATGVIPVFLTLIGVDVAIGPVITLIVFNPKKKSLRFDLAVIAVFQIAALSYGMHSVFIARPAYLVYNIDRFDLIQANDVNSESARRALYPSYRRPPLFGPLIVGAVLPADPKAREKMIFQSVFGGDDLPQLPEYYVAVDAQVDSIRAHMQSIELLDKLNPTVSMKLRQRIKYYEMRDQEFGFLPLRARVHDAAVIMQKQTGKVVEILALKPWNSK